MTPQGWTTVTEILETAKAGTYEDLLGQGRLDLQEYEPPTQPAMEIPSDTAGAEAPSSAMDEADLPQGADSGPVVAAEPSR